MLPRLRAMSFDERRRLLLQADEHAERHPLHLHREKNLSVPLWGDEPLTGAQVLALMCFAIWVHCNEDEHVAAPLLETWPIREGVTLCDGPDGPRRVITYEPPAGTGHTNADAEQFPLLALAEAAGRSDTAPRQRPTKPLRRPPENR